MPEILLDDFVPDRLFQPSVRVITCSSQTIRSYAIALGLLRGRCIVVLALGFFDSSPSVQARSVLFRRLRIWTWDVSPMP